MKALSRWGRDHSLATRFLLFLCHLLLFFLVLSLARQTIAAGLRIPHWVGQTFAVGAILTVLVYPRRRREWLALRNTYFTRKGCDFALVISGALALVCLLNQQAFLPTGISGYQEARAELVALHAKGSRKENRQARKGLRAEIKRAKSKLRAELKSWRRADQQGEPKKKVGLKILLTILTIGAMVGLGYLVAAFACGVTCSGAELMALVLFIGGLGLVVFLGVLALKAVFRKRPSGAP